MTSKPGEVTERMQWALDYFAGVDKGHRGDASANTITALCVRGLLCVSGWGMTEAGMNAPMYRITPAGREALRKERA